MHRNEKQACPFIFSQWVAHKTSYKHERKHQKWHFTKSCLKTTTVPIWGDWPGKIIKIMKEEEWRGRKKHSNSFSLPVQTCLTCFVGVMVGQERVVGNKKNASNAADSYGIWKSMTLWKSFTLEDCCSRGIRRWTET